MDTPGRADREHSLALSDLKNAAHAVRVTTAELAHIASASPIDVRRLTRAARSARFAVEAVFEVICFNEALSTPELFDSIHAAGEACRALRDKMHEAASDVPGDVPAGGWPCGAVLRDAIASADSVIDFIAVALGDVARKAAKGSRRRLGWASAGLGQMTVEEAALAAADRGTPGVSL